MKQENLPELLTVKDVEIWNPDAVLHHQNVVIRNGEIESIRPAENQEVVGVEIDGANKVLIPSGVDAHVHLRVPGQPEKETPETGLRAAIKGGYGALLNMPNTKPPTDSAEICDMAMAELQPAINNTGIEVYLSGCISKGLKGEELTNVDELAEWGVKTFTDDGLGVEKDELMAQVFAKASRWGVPVSQHAEYCGHGGVLAGGKTLKKLNLPAYPAGAEYDMVARDLNQLRLNPEARYHVLHVSSGKTVELIEKAWEEGLQVSCEVTPHHLFYTYNEIPEDNTSFKMNPPLRGGYDRDKLIKGIQNGTVAFVATDHAPHSQTDKGNEFVSSAYGTTGMETSLRVLFYLFKLQELSATRLVEVWASKPAEYLGIDHAFGKIKEGRPFNALLVDPQYEANKIETSDLESLGKNNVFVGTNLPGKLYNFYNTSYAFDLNSGND